MKQHAGLTAERWSSFTLDQRLLMIANEMHRGGFAMAPERHASLHKSYERVLRLVDLTIEVGLRRHLRRELLRWRGVVAELYVQEAADAAAHREALRALLYLSPEAAKQVAALGL